MGALHDIERGIIVSCQVLLVTPVDVVQMTE